MPKLICKDKKGRLETEETPNDETLYIDSDSIKITNKLEAKEIRIEEKLEAKILKITESAEAKILRATESAEAKILKITESAEAKSLRATESAETKTLQVMQQAKVPLLQADIVEGNFVTNIEKQMTSIEGRIVSGPEFLIVESGPVVSQPQAFIVYGSKLSKIGGPGYNRLIMLYFASDCNVESTSPPTTPLPTPSPTTTYPISLYPNATRIVSKGTTLRLLFGPQFPIWNEVPDASSAIQVRLPPSFIFSVDNPYLIPAATPQPQQVLLVYAPFGKVLDRINAPVPYPSTIMLYFATDCRIINRASVPAGFCNIALAGTAPVGATVQRYKGGILILKRTGSTYFEVT